MARNEELTKKSEADAIHLTQIKGERKNTGQLQASLKDAQAKYDASEAKREELTRAMESVRAELAKEKLKLAELEREYDTQQSEFVEAIEKERRKGSESGKKLEKIEEHFEELQALLTESQSLLEETEEERSKLAEALKEKEKSLQGLEAAFSEAKITGAEAMTAFIHKCLDPMVSETTDVLARLQASVRQLTEAQSQNEKLLEQERAEKADLMKRIQAETNSLHASEEEKERCHSQLNRLKQLAHTVAKGTDEICQLIGDGEEAKKKCTELSGALQGLLSATKKQRTLPPVPS